MYAAPMSMSYVQCALEFVEAFRIYNTSKSCDTLSPTSNMLETIENFVSIMDEITFGQFLMTEPTESTINAGIWGETKV